MRSTKEFTKFFPIGPQGPLSLCNPENLLAVQFGFYVFTTLIKSRLLCTTHGVPTEDYGETHQGIHVHIFYFFLQHMNFHLFPKLTQTLNLGVVRE